MRFENIFFPLTDRICGNMVGCLLKDERVQKSPSFTVVPGAASVWEITVAGCGSNQLFPRLFWARAPFFLKRGVPGIKTLLFLCAACTSLGYIPVSLIQWRMRLVKLCCRHRKHGEVKITHFFLYHFGEPMMFKLIFFEGLFVVGFSGALSKQASAELL